MLLISSFVSRGYTLYNTISGYLFHVYKLQLEIGDKKAIFVAYSREKKYKYKCRVRVSRLNDCSYAWELGIGNCKKFRKDSQEIALDDESVKW